MAKILKYTHFIWDYDGTLFDTYPIMADLFRIALQSRGIEESSINIRGNMEISMQHAIKYYKSLYQLDDDFFTRYFLLLNKAEEEALPFPEVEDLLFAIHKNGGANFIFTHRRESPKRFLIKSGLDIYFDDVITSANNFARKPSPEAISYLIMEYKIPQYKALMIGDRDMDIMSAVNAGIAACFVARAGELNTNANYIVDDLKGIYSIIGIEHELS